jgi:hypothetical protein
MWSQNLVLGLMALLRSQLIALIKIEPREMFWSLRPVLVFDQFVTTLVGSYYLKDFYEVEHVSGDRHLLNV